MAQLYKTVQSYGIISDFFPLVPSFCQPPPCKTSPQAFPLRTNAARLAHKRGNVSARRGQTCRTTPGKADLGKKPRGTRPKPVPA